MNRNGTGILRPNRICSVCRCCSTAFLCHCWHGAQAEGQGGAQQACEKTFCFFHFSTSSLKKVIIGWAAKPPGLGVLHQHDVQCGAQQRGNAAAPPALCRKEKREGKPGRLPTWLKVHLKTKEITDISQPQAGCKAKSHRNPFRIPRLFKP